MRLLRSLTQGIRLGPQWFDSLRSLTTWWLAMSEPQRGESNGPKRDRTADLLTASQALSQAELWAHVKSDKWQGIFTRIVKNCQSPADR